MPEQLSVNIKIEYNETLQSIIKNLENRVRKIEGNNSGEDYPLIPIGSIIAYGGHCEGYSPDGNAFIDYPIPDGYAWCDGAILDYQNEKYTKLFSVIGHSFKKSGDDFTDTTLFRLPDLRNQFIRGFSRYIGDNNTKVVGERISSQMPNITGRFDGCVTNNGAYMSGAFYYTGTSFNGSAAYGGTGCYLGFDASRTATVYQDGCAEVRPINKIVTYMIRIS